MLSKNAVGILTLVLSALGFTVADGQVAEFVSAALQVIGFILVLWHQVMEREDVHNFFFKNKE